MSPRALRHARNQLALLAIAFGVLLPILALLALGTAFMGVSALGGLIQHVLAAGHESPEPVFIPDVVQVRWFLGGLMLVQYLLTCGLSLLLMRHRLSRHSIIVIALAWATLFGPGTLLVLGRTVFRQEFQRLL